MDRDEGDGLGDGFDVPLVRRLPGVLGYAMVPSVWAVLFGLAVLVWFISAILSRGWVALLAGYLCAGLELAVFFQVARSSAAGHTTLEPPDFLSIHESISAPIYLAIAASAPILGAFAWAQDSILFGVPTFSTWPIGPLVLLGFGILLFPLLLTIAAIDGDLSRVLNPLLWFSSLRELGKDYWVAAIVFYALWAAEVYGFGALSSAIAGAAVPGALVPALLVVYLPRLLRYRLLGALCEPYLTAPLPDVIIAPLEETVEPPDTAAAMALERGELAPRAILRLVHDAARRRDHRLVYRAVTKLWREHQASAEVPQALMAAARCQEIDGDLRGARTTLSKLVNHHPSHPVASEARILLTRFEEVE